MSKPVKSVTLFRNPADKEVWSRTSRIWQRFIVSGFGLVILFSSWCVQAQENIKSKDVGFVLDIDGKWFLDGKLPQRILRGQSLPAKGTIRIQLPKAKSNKIEIILLNGERISRRCNKPEACNQPILLPEVIKSKSSPVDRVVVAVKEVFTSYPEKFVATFSFFQGAIELTEQWGRDGLEPDLIRSFLHACLASLAEPQSPARK
ncbi:MAG TPA: hypothetical protein VNM22_08740 [Candidatus Limnocylindrales bacterium]|nr:hypothetical protein [Candidatus Limnocylindrales bacterium]